MKTLFLTFLSLLVLTSCYYDSEEHLYGKDDCGPVDMSFKNDVEPIIKENCSTSGCHADAQTPLFTDLVSIQEHSAHIKEQIENGTMPPDAPLDSEKANKVICWINNGALDN